MSGNHEQRKAVRNSVPLHVDKNRIKWLRTSEGGTYAKAPRVASLMCAKALPLATRDIGMFVKSASDRGPLLGLRAVSRFRLSQGPGPESDFQDRHMY